MRVVFTGGGTGGHLYPGIAIARALVRERPDVEPHFVGAKRGIERDVLAKTEFQYTLLDMHPLYRTKPLENIKTLRGFASGWRQMSVLGAARPALIVGTGGYASSVPIFWGSVHGVPIVQHIGDAIPGIAAKVFARMSAECYLGFPEAEARLPRGTTYVVTGNPIEPPPSPRPDRRSLLGKFGFASDTRVLLVFGGSQGSSYINEVIAAWSRDHVPDGWSVLWGTGKTTYASYKHLDSARVRVVEYLSPIADAYAIADLALVRGGMMGTAELCAWGVPMIIVPLPTAAADHQTSNAKSLELAGAAINFPQRDLNPVSLASIVDDLIANPAKLAALGAGALGRGKPDAAAEIARRISRLLASHRQ